jgi:hypothetical protein
MRGLIAVIATCMSVLIAGCGARPAELAEPSPAGWPQQLEDFTMTWTAEPGIDLVTGAAVVVRAYLESYYLAVIADDEKYLYPGFRRAVAPNDPHKDATKDRWPSSDGAATWIGTVRHHILGLGRKGRDVTVLVCAYTYGSAFAQLKGYVANVENYRFNSGIFPVRVGLQEPEVPALLLISQQGPSRAPFTDVFGDWKVVTIEGGYLGTARWDDYDRDRATCVDKAYGPPESRHFGPAPIYARDQFPTLPATPGWPAPNAS